MGRQSSMVVLRDESLVCLGCVHSYTTKLFIVLLQTLPGPRRDQSNTSSPSFVEVS